MHKKRARTWDRTTTIVIVALLMLPFPFARFQMWPGGAVVSEHIISPWSRFRICYVTPQTGNPVEEVYRFTWKGEILPRHISSPHVFIIDSHQPPILKWHDTPELSLATGFYRGDFLKLETYWQPLLLWPFNMFWQMALRSK